MHIFGIKKKGGGEISPEDYLLVTTTINGLGRSRRHVGGYSVKSSIASRFDEQSWMRELDCYRVPMLYETITKAEFVHEI